jgi:hypothetical protein
VSIAVSGVSIRPGAIAVRGEALGGLDGVEGGDVDDGAAPGHVAGLVLDRQEHPGEAQVEHAPPFRQRKLGDRPEPAPVTIAPRPSRR